MAGVASKAADVVQYEHDVFIVYKTDEDHDLAYRIGNELERNSIKVTAQWKHDAFLPGRPIFESIVNCVHNSAKTLIILTKNALKSKWIILEAVQAIEQSKRCNVLTLRLLLHGVKDDDIAFLKRGMLASVPHFCLDFNKDNWQVVLLENIQNDLPLPHILPIEGSLAHGLVFSHYTGFLSYVLPELGAKIETVKIYKDMPLKVSRKCHILLPGSCKIYNSLESCDKKNRIWIEKEEDVKEFTINHAGKPRRFILSIYKISKETTAGIETYYFFADFPHVLNAMYTMSEKGLAAVDVRLQLARFNHVLGDVINHAENEMCFDTVKIIPYDENRETMQQAVFHAVKQSIETEVMQGRAEPDITNPLNEEMKTPQAISANAEKDVKADAAVYCLSDIAEDSQVADDITNYLESEKLTVYLDKGNERVFCRHPVMWHIFVLSKKTVMEPNTLLLRCFSLLHEGVCSNTVQVLPVTVGIVPEEVPRFIKWVTLVSTSEPKYCEKLLMSMRGGIVRMEHRLPSGDVATGLAWAYVINYLRITLLCRSLPDTGNLDLVGRIRRFLAKNQIECGCILKMFPVLPKSCTVEERLEDKANERLKGREVIKYLGVLEPVHQNTGGQLGRPFYLHVYMYCDPETGKDVCFIAEYFTPGNCLHEMAYKYPFAGLLKDDMVTQGERVVKLVPKILGLETVKEKIGDISGLVEIIYYDDNRESLNQKSLLSALRGHIQERSHAMVYAKDVQQNEVPSVCNR